MIISVLMCFLLLLAECDLKGCAVCSEKARECERCMDRFELSEDRKCKPVSSNNLIGIIAGEPEISV